jgi:DNA replication protein DnaC
LACALANAACRQGFTALYQRLPRLLEELALGRADGRYLKLMASFSKVDVLVLDDWGLAILDDARRRDLLELLDERYQTRSTVITSQLPVAHWHEALGDATLADAILDRLVHHAHPITLTGESLRKVQGALTRAAGVGSGPIDPGKAPSSVTAGP